MKKILIAGFACWSVLAVAQTSGSKDQAASAAQRKDQHPKEVASGHASGRVAPMNNGLEGKMSSGQPAITDNRKTASATEQNGNGQARVATGDLNGDGHADVTAAASPSKPTGSQAVLSDPAAREQVKAPRDLATGQASGKRQYQPVVIMKVQDQATPGVIEQQTPKATGDGKADVARVAKGDVNGDGKAEAAINNSHSNIKNTRDAASGQASGKRQHADNTVNKEADAAPKQ
jgi:FG-GAP repeat